MPFAQIFLVEGRTEETVRVMISDVPKTNWGIAGKSVKDLGR
jgi:4-oxalocrotonate tautomerase